MAFHIRFSHSLITPAAFSLVIACGAPGEEGRDVVDEASTSLTAVTTFGTNPGNLSMYEYAPARAPAGAPLVVALHGCTQSAAAYVNAGWNELADAWGFYVLYPESHDSTNCFQWYDAMNTTRGRGEALSIKQMVDAMKARHPSIDTSRVYITGLSAGGAMTAVMLATYPELFGAGAIMSGLPYRCAVSQSDAYNCMSPGKTQSASAWGDIVRAAYPGYAGPRPRVSVWHGQSDSVVRPVNETEIVKQFTNVVGLDAAHPTSTATVDGASHTTFGDASGNVLVESYSIPNMGHGTAIKHGFAPGAGCGSVGAFIVEAGICSTYYAARFFGLGPSASRDGAAGGAPPTGAGGTRSGGGTDGGGPGAGHGGASTSGQGGAQPAAPPPPPFACRTFHSTNYGHVVAGRATRCGVGGSYVCAVGSGTQFGLWTTMPSDLREPAPAYFEPGACP